MLAQMLEQRLVGLGRVESVRIGDDLTQRRPYQRAARQLFGRGVEIAAEDRATRRRERFEVSRHLARALGRRASTVQMRDTDRYLLAAEFHVGDQSRRVADA